MEYNKYYRKKALKYKQKIQRLRMQIAGVGQQQIPQMINHAHQTINQIKIFSLSGSVLSEYHDVTFEEFVDLIIYGFNLQVPPPLPGPLTRQRCDSSSKFIEDGHQLVYHEIDLNEFNARQQFNNMIGQNITLTCVRLKNLMTFYINDTIELKLYKIYINANMTYGHELISRIRQIVGERNMEITYRDGVINGNDILLGTLFRRDGNYNYFSVTLY